ncbi:MAG: glycine zipper 2TM domain-containing protein [Deltaproteobacteria bacterium]|jgi:outer membrane lipoprotein SlyB|nr:glycine zipper 2TM domain-containing protein [Deltaproteobacteria bacterium]
MRRQNARLFICAFLLAALAGGLMLTGCASRGGKTYSDSEVRSVQTVQWGSIISVKDVLVEEDPSFVGPAIGGVAGGILGSLIGAGSGRTLTILGGAALGALVGGAGESAVRRYQATELTVELENGQIIVIVQGNDELFVNGDQVRVLHTGEGRARVQHR